MGSSILGAPQIPTTNAVGNNTRGMASTSVANTTHPPPTIAPAPPPGGIMGSQPSLLGNPPFHLLVPQNATQTRPTAVYYSQFDSNVLPGPAVLPSSAPNQFPSQPQAPGGIEQVSSDQLTCPDTPPVIGFLGNFIGREATSVNSEPSMSVDPSLGGWNKFGVAPTLPIG